MPRRGWLRVPTVNDRVRFRSEPSPVASILVLAWRDAPLLLNCLRSISASVHAVPYEVVLVLNEPTPQLLSAVERQTEGVTAIRTRVNVGYGGAMNLAAMRARGRYLVLLNDDAEVTPDWLEELVDLAERRPEAGAVGSTTLFPDGSIQEAGCVIWADGSTVKVGRGLPGGSRAFDYERLVDFSSGTSLLLRRSTWETLGGMDDRYYPAYYEDTDLCLRIAELGQRVWYQPRSVVRHEESASTNATYRSFLFTRNREIFSERWSELLANREPAAPGDPIATGRAVHHAMGSPRRVLLIDDQVADPMIGSGYPRMYEVFLALQHPGETQLSLFTSLIEGSDHTDSMCRLGVEVLEGHDEAALERDLQQSPVGYDVAVISRPHNFERFAPVLRRCSPRTRIAYDAEALFSRRLTRQAELAVEESSRVELSRAAVEMRATEQRIAEGADALVAISEEEATFFRAHARGPVLVHGPLLDGIHATPATFNERADLAFVAGWAASGDSPNLDGVTWFAREVLPIVTARVPGVRLLVTGTGPPEAALRVSGPSLVFIGSVPDLAQLYNSVRVVVVPMRYGAGIKNKTIEALQYGVPTVSTQVGAEGIETAPDVLLVTDDPRDFARAVAALLEDRTSWEVQRRRIEDQHQSWANDSASSVWPAVVDALSPRLVGATAR